MKKVFNSNKTRKNYHFKDALLDAKKIYRSGKNALTVSAPRAVKDLGKIVRKTIGKKHRRSVGKKQRRSGHK